uniref:Solute carrier family 25 member 32 n=1 Tax=Plectus sambesii TaxID=2011161 RepID=A0A914W0R7_9BILA
MVSAQFDHLAGGIAGGFTSTLVCHPLDLLKVRFSANEGDPMRPQYRSYWHAAKSIVSSQGVRGLYQGVTPNLIGATVSWGLYFQFYNITKDRMRSAFGVSELAPAYHLASGMIAGTSVMAVTNPIWVVKTQLCLQYETQQKAYRGFSDALVKIYKKEGIRGLYRGFVPGIIGTSHGALQFMAYDYLKERKCKRLNIPATSKLDTTDYLLYSSVSKIFAVTTTFPYQVVRTRLQDQHVQYRGVVDVVVKTYKREGIRGFYKGLLPSNLRVLPAICITFVVYENVVQMLASFKS